MPRFEGIVEDIRFRNEQNGWTVITLRYGKQNVAAVGVMPFLSAGEHIAIQGEWTEHRDYGAQIKVESYETMRPKTKTAIERYLASGLIRGIGPKTAKVLVDYFGDTVLDVLDTNPDRLCEVPGIKGKRAEMIAESYLEHREMQSTILFLQEYDISMNLALKIYKKFGMGARHILEKDPYRLVDEIDGVGFKSVDAIARGMGFSSEDEHRIKCGIRYVLVEAGISEGHMFLPEMQLRTAASALLGVDDEMLEIPLQQLIFSDSLHLEVLDGEKNFYLPEYFEAEQDVARRIMRLWQHGVAPIASLPRMDVELGEEQLEAVKMCMENPITIITGGPGTGKTTCIQCIIRMLGDKVELCAPTGRAAKRITESTGRNARTVHRMLEYNGEDGKFQRDEDSPLDCRAIIVDEMSMVDIFLMRSLLRAIALGTRIILVGDADQLPSVGAGNVLSDLIQCGRLPVARLTRIYRQAQESMIVLNAHKINGGDMPVLRTKETNFFFERKDTGALAAQSVLALVKTRLPGFAGLDSLRDIQVMAPMKKGETGVYEMNRLLQEALNPRKNGKAELVRGDSIFRVGDKVMQTKNNYDLMWEKDGEDGEGVFNGDIGFITDIQKADREITVLFDDGREAVYSESDIDALEHAYCISVHKSQGSEFEAVVLPLVSGPPMLMNRNLLYTAVTRAKKLVVIVGREGAIWQMVSNKRIQLRYSALDRRLSK